MSFEPGLPAYTRLAYRPRHAETLRSINPYKAATVSCPDLLPGL
ncbi:hypothetical protein [Gluconobacter sp. DsW_056]|nr:hypothetical protein [Gluconobacter sp. DsW_056]